MARCFAEMRAIACLTTGEQPAVFSLKSSRTFFSRPSDGGSKVRRKRMARRTGSFTFIEDPPGLGHQGSARGNAARYNLPRGLIHVEGLYAEIFLGSADKC